MVLERLSAVEMMVRGMVHNDQGKKQGDKDFSKNCYNHEVGCKFDCAYTRWILPPSVKGNRKTIDFSAQKMLVILQVQRAKRVILKADA